MNIPGRSTVVALVVGVLMASAAFADDRDLSVLVGKWQGRVEGFRDARFLIIERVEGNIAHAQYGTPDKDSFPVQVGIQPDPDGGARHFVDFYTPSIAGGNHVTVR